MAKALIKKPTAGLAEVGIAGLNSVQELARHVLANPASGIAVGEAIVALCYKSGLFDPREHTIQKIYGRYRWWAPPSFHWNSAYWEWIDTGGQNPPPPPEHPECVWGLDMLALGRQYNLPANWASFAEWQVNQDTHLTKIFYNGQLIWSGYFCSDLGYTQPPQEPIPTGYWRAFVLVSDLTHGQKLMPPSPGYHLEQVNGGTDPNGTSQPGLQTMVIDTPAHWEYMDIVEEGTTEFTPVSADLYYIEWLRTSVTEKKALGGYRIKMPELQLGISPPVFNFAFPEITYVWETDRTRMEQMKEEQASMLAGIFSSTVALAGVLYAIGSKANETHNISVEK